jgi:putative membrane protein
MRSVCARSAWLSLVIVGLVGGTAIRADDEKPISDSEFVKKVSCAGMAEVKAGEIAMQKANDPKVKELAQKVIDEHTKANKELEELASRKGWTVEKAIEDKHQKEIDRLSNMSGQEFDKAFADCQVKAHEEAVKLFENESRSGQDADLKSWAAKTLPTLREHLELAKNLPEKKDR